MAARRATAVSAVLLSLGLSGVVLLAVAPLVGASANASAAVLDPVEPCDVDVCMTPEDPVTTITITTSLPTPTPEDPVTTVTTTVTPSSTPEQTTKKPTPTQTTNPTPEQQDPAPLPTTDIPPVTLPEEEDPVETPPVTLPSVDTGTPPGQIVPSDQPPTSQGPDSVPLEVRNAAPEYDQVTLSRKLGIPALVLVLLALFAVLIFEGRLRRMAHAAAVRKAGPQPPGRHRAEPTEPYGYPAGPGFAGPIPAYAPIISFVPVQTYPGGPAQYAPVYQQPFITDPNAYGHPQDPTMYGHPQDPTMYGHVPYTQDMHLQDPYGQQGVPGQPETFGPEGGVAQEGGAGQPGMLGHEGGLTHEAMGQPDGPGEPGMAGPQGGFGEPESRGSYPGVATQGLSSGMRSESSGQAEDGERVRSLFEPLKPPAGALGDMPPGGAAPFTDSYTSSDPGERHASLPGEHGDAEPWQYDHDSLGGIPAPGMATSSPPGAAGSSTDFGGAGADPRAGEGSWAGHDAGAGSASGIAENSQAAPDRRDGGAGVDDLFTPAPRHGAPEEPAATDTTMTYPLPDQPPADEPPGKRRRWGRRK